MYSECFTTIGFPRFTTISVHHSSVVPVGPLSVLGSRLLVPGSTTICSRFIGSRQFHYYRFSVHDYRFPGTIGFRGSSVPVNDHRFRFIGSQFTTIGSWFIGSRFTTIGSGSRLSAPGSRLSVPGSSVPSSRLSFHGSLVHDYRRNPIVSVPYRTRPVT